jgi:hypothetical protein
MTEMRQLSNVPRLIFAGLMFVSALHAQAPRQLQIEVGSNQHVAIVANDVSYGEVLRVLGQKLGWDIDIPAVADKLKISRVHVEGSKPQDALKKLLEGSQLGYAFRDAHDGSLKVSIIPFDGQQERTAEDRETSVLEQDKAKPQPSSTTSQTQASTRIQVSDPVVGVPNRPEAHTMSLSEAIEAIGAPPGVPSSDVGRKATFTSSDAAKVMGVPPGVSPDAVGRSTTLPMSEAAKIIGVPPGVSPSDVGKILTLPLPTGSSKRP